MASDIWDQAASQLQLAEQEEPGQELVDMDPHASSDGSGEDDHEDDGEGTKDQHAKAAEAVFDPQDITCAKHLNVPLVQCYNNTMYKSFVTSKKRFRIQKALNMH